MKKKYFSRIIAIALAAICFGCSSGLNPAYFSQNYPSMSDEDLILEYYQLNSLIRKNGPGVDTADLESRRDAIGAELLRRNPYREYPFMPTTP